MKTILISVMLLFANGITYGSIGKTMASSNLLLFGGTITCIEDLLTVDAEMTDNTIINVKVYDAWANLVADFKGCNSNYCQYDVSSLSNGTYYVHVQGKYYNFNGTIII